MKRIKSLNLLMALVVGFSLLTYLVPVKASSATGAATYTVTLTKSGNSFAAVTKANVQ